MREMVSYVDILVGETITEILNHGRDFLRFKTDLGYEYQFYHDQDCCEDVFIYDIKGDLYKLIGKPLTDVRSRKSVGDFPDWAPKLDNNPDDSWTWTQFKFVAFDDITVEVIWLGTSNGYYNEDVFVSREKID